MNNAIVRSQHHHALLPSVGPFVLPSSKIGLGRIVAVCVDSDTPLFVQTPNGAIFPLGGLSDRQKNQLTQLLPDIIHTRVRFQYRRLNALGQAVDAVFQTVIISGDSRANAQGGHHG